MGRTVRYCNTEECGDEVCVDTWNDGKGHACIREISG
jgi:hypothetical protein